MSEADYDIHHKTKRWLSRWCANLKPEDVIWEEASLPTSKYNCFGFALGRREWWNPPIFIGGIRKNPTHAWPRGLLDKDDDRNVTVDDYVEAAKTEGFEVVDDYSWQANADIIVLYFVVSNRKFHHAARQKSAGVWESKLGDLSDITHPLNGLDNIQWGHGRIYMKRRHSTA